MSLKDNLKKVGGKLSRFFPIPNYLSLEPYAIDISPEAIRVFKLKRKPVGYIPDVATEVRFKTPHDLTNVNMLPEHRANAIRVLSDLKKKLKMKHVVVSLPETQNYIYRTRIPREAAIDINSAIYYGVEEQVPFSPEDVLFDYKVVGYVGKQIEVVVSVFPKTVIATTTKILEEAGLLPMSYISESTALSDAIISKKDKGLYLVVRVMNDRVNASVVEGGAAQYTTSIEVSGSEVQNDLNGLAANKLTQELNKVLIYWFTSQKGTGDIKKIEKGILVGNGAEDEKLIEYLEDGTKIDFDTANVWSNCFSQNEYTPNISPDKSLKYGVAVGLALRGVKYM